MKKIIFAWPPMQDPKGYATIGQNRQFQWLKDPTFIYPIIPALACTMLATKGHQMLWLDAIAEELDEVEFGRIIVQSQPDYMVFECPTPLIGRYIEIINGIKDNMPNTKIILCGEHVTAMDVPGCKADHFVKGGKWFNDVYEIIEGEKWPHEGKYPHIDRNISRWWLYAYRNGNFKYIPGTYIMSAIDCWHRPGCTFCSWGVYHPDCDIRPVDDVLQEVEMLVRSGFKEIFDDSGTFPVGEWLREFCRKVIEKKLNNHVAFGCNMRFGALQPDDFVLMARAGFRMVLWGVESVNQTTLDRLNKGVKIKQIVSDLAYARAAGLDSHLTVMFGFPWESLKEAQQTFNMVKYWLLNGYAFSAQATICIPYPITPLWKECKEQNLLLTEEWAEYDMSRAVMKVPYDEKELFKLQKGIYNLALHPKFILQKLLKIRNLNDLKYYLRIAKKIYDRFGNFYETGKVAK